MAILFIDVYIFFFSFSYSYFALIGLPFSMYRGELHRPEPRGFVSSLASICTIV